VRPSRPDPARKTPTAGETAASPGDARARVHVVAERDGRLLVSVRVVPRASREAIELDGPALRVRLTAPPVEGAANAALVALFASRLRLPKRAISLVRGATSREKQLAIEGLSAADFWARLGL
jgi:uncharacterized protein